MFDCPSGEYNDEVGKAESGNYNDEGGLIPCKTCAAGLFSRPGLSSCDVFQPATSTELKNKINECAAANYECTQSPIGRWDLSQLSGYVAGPMFSTTFNEGPLYWDLSGATSMSSFFKNAAFNQPLVNWQTGSHEHEWNVLSC